jgi:hypothetical protein
MWFGEEYQSLYPGRVFTEGIAGGWTDNDEEKEAYYDTCCEEFLIENVNYAEFFDDTMPMIRALYKRNPERAIELAQDIVDKKKSYDFLQEEAKTFLSLVGFMD